MFVLQLATRYPCRACPEGVAQPEHWLEGDEDVCGECYGINFSVAAELCSSCLAEFGHPLKSPKWCQCVASEMRKDRCENCNGTGKVTIHRGDVDISFGMHGAKSKTLQGTIEHPCPTCQGYQR